MKRLVNWLFLFMLIAAPASACPMCKESFANSADGKPQGRARQGYAISVAALLGAPVLLIGGIATAVVRSARRRRS